MGGTSSNCLGEMKSWIWSKQRILDDGNESEEETEEISQTGVEEEDLCLSVDLSRIKSQRGRAFEREGVVFFDVELANVQCSFVQRKGAELRLGKANSDRGGEKYTT